MVSCAKIVEGGLACGAEAQRDSIYCFMHDDRPATLRKLRAARSRGGKAAHAPLDPSGLTVDVSSADAILTSLGGVAQAVLDGRLDRSRAGGAVYALQAAVAALKLHRFEERLHAVERRLNLVEPTLGEQDTEDDVVSA
jgi:hypothetical protein